MISQRSVVLCRMAAVCNSAFRRGLSESDAAKPKWPNRFDHAIMLKMQFPARSVIIAAAFLILSSVPVIGADWERGVSMYNKDDFRGALAEFQAIVRDRPDAAGAWYY